MITVPAPAAEGSPGYEVRIGSGLLGSIAGAARAHSRVLVVSDTNVAPLHLERLGLADGAACVVPPGEASKSFAGLERVLDAAAAAGLDRGSCIVALGGGMIGDLAGLAASLYMRGIACIQAPTSLLAMVDSSIGGKTAINLAAGKNLAGRFHPPELVVADTDTLASLPEAELRSGLGEVVKMALIEGEEALGELEAHAPALLRRDPGALERTIARCVRAKAQIVARDPWEAGDRRLLNLGHTFAHAIEHAAGYGRIPHGVAVAVGVALAIRTSAELGLLADAGLPGRVDRLLAALGLPRDLAALRRTGSAIDPQDVLRAMSSDKKARGGRVRFVLPASAGRIAIDAEAQEAAERVLTR